MHGILALSNHEERMTDVTLLDHNLPSTEPGRREGRSEHGVLVQRKALEEMHLRQKSLRPHKILVARLGRLLRVSG